MGFERNPSHRQRPRVPFRAQRKRRQNGRGAVANRVVGSLHRIATNETKQRPRNAGTWDRTYSTEMSEGQA